MGVLAVLVPISHCFLKDHVLCSAVESQNLVWAQRDLLRSSGSNAPAMGKDTFH